MLKLTKAISHQNSYTLARPVTLDGTLTGYAKIILFLDKGNKPWNRIDLVNLVLDRNLVPGQDRGTMCNIFATMRASNILSYNKRDKTWDKGSNFEKYISTKLSDWRE